MQRLNLLLLSFDFDLEFEDVLVLLVDYCQHLVFPVFEEGDSFEQTSEGSFVFIVLHLLLVLVDPFLVLLDGGLHFRHVLFVALHELGLLSPQQPSHLAL